MTPKLKSLLIALGIAALPLLAQARPDADGTPDHCGEPPKHGPGMPDGAMLEHGAPLPPYLHSLELSETQSDGIFDILHAQAPQVRSKINAMRKAHEALSDLALSGRYDEAKARELANAIADDTAVLSLLHAQADARIYALLTPEQRKQVDEVKAKHGFRPADFGRAPEQVRARAM